MNYDENLEALRAVIAAECDDRMARDHQLSNRDVATWLVTHKRAAVIGGLADLVCQVMEQGNDDERAERAKPEPQPVEDDLLLRLASRALGVPLWYLLGLDDERRSHCYAAAQLIYELRSEEAAADIEATKQFLRPVMDGHPNMTAGEALREIERRTDETIRGLEPPPEGAS